ncbi:hypothetical protein K7432_009915 [Basidiobolus ranarum]|uniref:Uncharacterized protein n=1 Tax=Basidiobolus ranarum TaxID=34480 RepID=A0ABR2VWG7_9FUNG
MISKDSQFSTSLNMPRENPSSIKPTIVKNSLKRRLSGIFLPDNGVKLAPTEVLKCEKPPVVSSLSAEVIEKPNRRFFSFPSYLKKTKAPTAPLMAPVKVISPIEPVMTAEIEIQKKSVSKTTIYKDMNETPGPQYTYRISIQKLQQSSRRPLVQVLLIHQTITKATLKLRSEGIHPAQLMREQKLAVVKNPNRTGPVVRRRSFPILQRQPPPPPYSSVDGKKKDQDDDVPLGLLRREFLKPTSVSVLVA